MSSSFEKREGPEKRPLLDLSSVASWPYVPSNLRHLRPPVPNDLPPDQDSSIFAFEDAFEDLMAVSQGGALPDINTRYHQRQLLRQMYPNGEPTWFWLQRLESQGLLVRRPGSIDWMRAASDDDFGGALGRYIESVFQSAFPRLHWPDWDEFHDQLARRAQDVWRRDGVANIDHGTCSAGDSVSGREASPHKSRCPLGSEKSSPTSTKDSCQNGHHSQWRGLLPDTFDDFFSHITSGFAEGQKSWDTFVKIIMDNNRDTNKKAPGGATETTDNLKTRQDDPEQYRDREVVTRDEHIDQFGYVHTTVVRKTYDKDGNEIASQTHFTMRPAEKESITDGKGSQKETELNADPDANVIDRTATNREVEDHPKSDKKQGWFWK